MLTIHFVPTGLTVRGFMDQNNSVHQLPGNQEIIITEIF